MNYDLAFWFCVCAVIMMVSFVVSGGFGPMELNLPPQR